MDNIKMTTVFLADEGKFQDKDFGDFLYDDLVHSTLSEAIEAAFPDVDIGKQLNFNPNSVKITVLEQGLMAKNKYDQEIWWVKAEIEIHN